MAKRGEKASPDSVFAPRRVRPAPSFSPKARTVSASSSAVSTPAVDEDLAAKRTKELLDKVVFYRARNSVLTNENKRLSTQVKASGSLQSHIESEELIQLRSKCNNLERIVALIRRHSSMTGLLLPLLEESEDTPRSYECLTNGAAEAMPGTVDDGAPVPRLALEANESAPGASPSNHSRFQDGMLSARSLTGSTCGSARVVKTGRLSGCSAILLSPRRSERNGLAESPGADSLQASVDRLTKRVTMLLELGAETSNLAASPPEHNYNVMDSPPPAQNGMQESPAVNAIAETPLSLASVSSAEASRASLMADLTQLNETIQTREALYEQCADNLDTAEKVIREKDVMLQQRDKQIEELKARVEALEHSARKERVLKEAMGRKLRAREEDDARRAAVMRDAGDGAGLRTPTGTGTSNSEVSTQAVSTQAASLELPPSRRGPRSGTPSPPVSASWQRGLVANGGPSERGRSGESSVASDSAPRSMSCDFLRSQDNPLARSASNPYIMHCARPVRALSPEPLVTEPIGVGILASGRRSPGTRYRSPSPSALLKDCVDLRHEVEQLVKLRDDPPETRDGCTVFRSHWRLIRPSMPPPPVLAPPMNGAKIS